MTRLRWRASKDRTVYLAGIPGHSWQIVKKDETWVLCSGGLMGRPFKTAKEAAQAAQVEADRIEADYE